MTVTDGGVRAQVGPKAGPVWPETTQAASEPTPAEERAHSPAASVFPALSLAQVNARAKLQTRVDTKYLLDPFQFAEFSAALATQEDWAVLQIDGGHQFRYRSVYFDTPDLLTFRHHRQGKRRRFKVRTRTYVDSGECAFEVKVRGARAATVKQRMDYAAEDADRITPVAWSFLTSTLRQAYGVAPPAVLRPMASTEYLRQTYVQLSSPARLTCDTGFVCSSEQGQVVARPMWVVESKSASGAGAADKLLWTMGVRPSPISKYCLATAMLRPHLSANRWRRARRTWFAPHAG
ncbi:polyphosphate polymerase domain-containing protein [Natronoglycomyces albus]|uniref:Polyphosphate polymerase domain-containing protein n=1 Tax=Natronoglycomyces albus TaxID=2811108 RepID=A0A895XNR4_9ACTN|nr:polyphosphate polymerase domain-containing protein [Natronoglycomyces albus]QSB05183.1 polyphosphate polymerase domain-containing protein [Natronoglycomyces albus]